MSLKTEQAGGENFRILFQNMNEILSIEEIIYNEQGELIDWIFIDVNPAFEAVYDLSRDEVIGRRATEAYRLKEVPEPQRTIFARVASTGSPETFETYFSPLGKHFLVSTYSLGRNRLATISTDITELKRTEAALVENEQKYRMLFNNANDAIFLSAVDESGNTLGFIEVNDVACNRLGYTREELLSMSAADIAGPGYAEKLPDFFREVLYKGRQPVEWVHKAKSGELIPVELSSRAFTSGGRTLVLTIARDISERKHAEEELAKSRELLYTVVDSVPAAIYLKDLEGRLMLINREFEKIIGIPKAQILGRTDYDYLPKESAESITTNDRIVIESGKPLYIEEALPLPDGEHIYISIKVPAREPDGTIYGICGVSTDITEHKRIQRQAAEQASTLTAILDTVPVGIVLAEAESGNISYCSKFAEVILGQPAVGKAGSPEPASYKLLHLDGSPFAPDDLPLLRSLRGEATTNTEIMIRRRDGSEVTVVSNSAPIIDAEGRISAAVASLDDISELVALRHDLQQALRRANAERERASALENIAEAGIATTDMSEFLDILILRMTEILKIQSCSMWMLDEGTREFIARTAYGVAGYIGSRLGTDEGVSAIVYRERRPVYVPNAEEDPLVLDKASKEQHIKSLLAVPLIARNKVVGMARLGRLEARAFTEQEIKMVEAMASRAAQAIDNIKLYDALTRSRGELGDALDREQHFSLLLQRALLPRIAELGTDYNVAAEYVPVYEGREIGGDFYDVFRAGERWAGVLIGDVAGKGLEAASMAATTRSTIHAFVHEAPSSAKALELADAVLSSQHTTFGVFATVFLVIIDLLSGNMNYADAGHPPAMIYRADGRVELLKTGQMPLALDVGQKFEEHRDHLDPGDRLVLYTDGISESRHDSELFEIEGIAQTLEQHGQLCASELTQVLITTATDWANGKLKDDAAVVVVEKKGSAFS